METTEFKIEKGLWRSHQEQSAAAHDWLCRLLGSSVTVEHNSNGAPFVTGRPDLHVSISHCRTAVAVAISTNHRIGIDIESRRKTTPGLMERVCSPDELATIQASPDATMAFLRLWTKKEAVLKMRGTGIKGFDSMVGDADTVAALATAL